MRETPFSLIKFASHELGFTKWSCAFGCGLLSGTATNVAHYRLRAFATRGNAYVEHGGAHVVGSMTDTNCSSTHAIATRAQQRAASTDMPPLPDRTCHVARVKRTPRKRTTPVTQSRHNAPSTCSNGSDGKCTANRPGTRVDLLAVAILRQLDECELLSLQGVSPSRFATIHSIYSTLVVFSSVHLFPV